MRDTRGFGNVEAVMAGGPPEPPALCSGALPGSVCVGFPLRGLLVGLPKLVHSTLIHGIKPATRPCGRQAGWRARGNTRVLGAGQPGLGGSGPVGETGVGLPCALLPFLEWSGQTSAPEAAAGSCTHAEAGARARAPDTRSAGPWPASRSAEQGATCSRGGQTDSAPAPGAGRRAPSQRLPRERDWGRTHHRWHRYTRNTTSSLKQASRWEVGMVMTKANTSSMKVLKACGWAGP